jgi:MYXO-CTERM domain-containing protein
MASCGWLACAPPVDSATQTAAITQGIATQDPAVVAIIGPDGTVGCSGTLIAPHTVLTAGHCVPPLRRRELRVFFGDSVGGAGQFIAVSDTHVHPEHVPATLAHDLALFTLREPGPVGALSLDPRTLDASLVGQTLRMVGFGVTAPDAGDSGTKRSGTARVTGLDPVDVTVVGAPSLPCRADSGGPALLDDGSGERIAAVVSRGDAACVVSGAFARIDVARASFIAPYLAATGPGTAATGDPCFYDGHCAEGTCRQAADDPLLYFCARPCGDGCPAAMTCAASECRHPLPSPGALGSSCLGAEECTSDDCYRPDDGDGTCTRSCLGKPDSCPAGFECAAIDTFVNNCLPEPGGCGCTAGAHSGGWILPVGLIVALRLRRRQRRLLHRRL